jgi:hypothetical protein
MKFFYAFSLLHDFLNRSTFSQVRIMKGKESNGYAFVTFKTKELASKAMDELNNSEFKVCWHLIIVFFLKYIWCLYNYY